jgi:hypothetical protein
MRADEPAVSSRPPDKRKAALARAAFLKDFGNSNEPNNATANAQVQRAARMLARRHGLRITIAFLIADLAGIGGAP